MWKNFFGAFMIFRTLKILQSQVSRLQEYSVDW